MADLMEFVAKAEKRRLAWLEQMRMISDYLTAVRAARAVRQQLTSGLRVKLSGP
jgi:hypothetical protein